MTTDKTFPANWLIASDFDPKAQLMNLKGRDYLNVQSRMVWFIRDQRALIAAGMATQSYHVLSDLVEIDRERGFAHFRATVTDVLGNQSVAYGSETSKDFGDYIEKAATKALGRALIGLGYGTQFAPEMDEGERVVDSPIERRAPASMPSAPAASPLPAAPRALPVDPVAIALRDQKTLDLLVEMGRIGPEDQYREVESVIEAIAARGGVRNHSVIRTELRQRMQDTRDMSAEANDLSELPVGVRGN